jgi:hypothetical protein
VAVPTLAVNATAERPITWSAPMPSATYRLDYAPDAVGLGRLTFTVKAGTQTAAGVTIVIRATTAVGTAGVLHVMASTS